MTTLIPKYDQGSTGAVNRPYNIKLQEYVSVLDFGADNSGATDCSAAFQNAINALSSGGTLYVPPGNYTFTNYVTIATANITVTGEGIINFPSSLSWVGTGANTAFFIITADNVKIFGLNFNGNNITPPSGKDYWPILFLSGGTNSSVLDCYFYNFSHQTGGHSGAPIGYVTTSASGGIVSNCNFLNCHGGVFTQSPLITVSNNTFQTITDTPVAINGASAVGCIVNANIIVNTGDYPAIAVEESPSDFVITNNNVRNCSTAVSMYNSAVLQSHAGGVISNNNFTINPGYAGTIAPVMFIVRQYYTGTIIEGNKFFCDTTGLTLTGSGSCIYSFGSTDVQISNNLFDCVNGISYVALLSGPGEVVFSNNKLNMNNATSTGVLVSSGSNIVADIVDNYFDAPTDYSVQFQSSSNWTGILRNNTFTNVGTSAQYYGSVFGNISVQNSASPSPIAPHSLSNETGNYSTIYAGSGKAAPTGGTWKVGDRVINIATIGSPKAWSCTTAGTPGTWTSEGNL